MRTPPMCTCRYPLRPHAQMIYYATTPTVRHKRSRYTHRQQQLEANMLASQSSLHRQAEQTFLKKRYFTSTHKNCTPQLGKLRANKRTKQCKNQAKARASSCEKRGGFNKKQSFRSCANADRCEQFRVRNTSQLDSKSLLFPGARRERRRPSVAPDPVTM